MAGAARIRDAGLLVLVGGQAVAIALLLLGSRDAADAGADRTAAAPARTAPSETAAPGPGAAPTPHPPATASPEPAPAAPASPVEAFIRDLAGTDIPEPEVREAVFTALRANDPAIALRLAETLRDTRDPSMLEFLKSALGWGKAHPAALPLLIAIARQGPDQDRRRIAIESLAESTSDQGAFDALCEISASRSEAEPMRIAAVDSLLCVQQFPYRGGEERSPVHLAHLKAIIASDAPAAVRAAATRQLFGAGDDEADVRYLVDLARQDRSPEVQIAAMGAFPTRWRMGDESDDKCYEALAAIAADEAQAPGARLAALLAGMGMSEEQQALARRLLAEGAKGECPNCRKPLPGEIEGCHACAPLRRP